ncbi:nuclear transport factor 2 family protein [Pseudarthrobacter sp. Fe7]|nr:nuclear transport factor 2 family protein [Pseudarthrobacter sp. Fe7]
MDTLRELFAEDAVWHIGGTGPLSGDKKGRDAILAYFGELYSRSNGTLKVTLDDVASGGQIHDWRPVGPCGARRENLGPADCHSVHHLR